jgi:hypothetical protein
MHPGHFRLRHVLVPLAASVLASGTMSATAGATTRATTRATTSALAGVTDAAVTTAASLAWHAVAVQAPAGGLGTVAGGAASDILSTGNITCLSTSDCIVAGDLEDQDVYPETSRAVIWHWDGKLWASQATGISGDAALVGTACASPTECWAMGAQYVGKGLATTEGVMEHYDGKTWSPVSLPGATGVAQRRLVRIGFRLPGRREPPDGNPRRPRPRIPLGRQDLACTPCTQPARGFMDRTGGDRLLCD